MYGGGAPVLVLNQNTKRDQGKKVQLGNIQAAKTVSDVIRTCLGPKAMYKVIIRLKKVFIKLKFF
jgi:T-complex protein 1 subunit gamma